jgi:anaerobic selenocysteine-containing dehydrogenase
MFFVTDTSAGLNTLTRDIRGLYNFYRHNERYCEAVMSEIVKDSICYMCGESCRIKVHVRDGTAVGIDMANDRIADICPRWKAQLDFVYHPERITYPLRRTGERGEGSFARITWDEALDTVVDGLQKIKAEHGPESVVFYISYVKEPRPYFHRLTHLFGSPNYCTESSNCYLATMIAATLNYGDGYGGFCGQSIDLEPESKCLILWSSSIANSAARWWNDLLALKQRGLKLIVIDPRRTRVASMADVFLQLRPGTDGALALGMMNVIIAGGLYDREFVSQWTSGFDELHKMVNEYSPEKVEQITRVPANEIRRAAIMFAENKPAKIRSSASSTVHCSNGVQNTRAIYLLPALTGNLEVSGGNSPPLKQFPANNVTLHERISGMPPGLGSDRFPLFTPICSETQANVIADRIEDPHPYPMKALFAAGLNLQFFAGYKHMTGALKQLDMIVDLDYFHNAGTYHSDIVLPIASWLERQMLVTRNGDHVELIEPVIAPVGECRPEWEIYAELARRLGFGDEFWDGDFDRCLDYILEPSGITVEQLRKSPEGIDYPVTQRPPKYYEKAGFKTPSGKVEIVSSLLKQHGYNALPVYREPAESPISRPDLAEQFPLVLTTGARSIYYTHSQHRNLARLREMYPEPLVDIHPDDAEQRRIKSGDMAIVSSPRGSITLKANVTDMILQGVVHIPHHWPGELNVNNITDDRNLDPISGFAPFKSQLCQVTKK